MEAELFESFYDSMSVRDKHHMANKLWKHDSIGATKVLNELAALKPVEGEFKVGDRVNCIDCGYSWGATTGTIINIWGGSAYVKVDAIYGTNEGFNEREGYCHTFSEVSHLEAS